MHHARLGRIIPARGRVVCQTLYARCRPVKPERQFKTASCRVLHLESSAGWDNNYRGPSIVRHVQALSW
eukprot:5428077-Alexandrium_andersonii.AAC.1